MNNPCKAKVFTTVSNAAKGTARVVIWEGYLPHNQTVTYNYIAATAGNPTCLWLFLLSESEKIKTIQK